MAFYRSIIKKYVTPLYFLTLFRLFCRFSQRFTVDLSNQWLHSSEICLKLVKFLHLACKPVYFRGEVYNEQHSP